MGYYQRYITMSDAELTMPLLAAVLKSIDAAYTVGDSPFDDIADLLYADVICGQIEINRVGDDLFEEDVADLHELVEDSGSPNEQRVLSALENAKAVVAVEAVWEGPDSRWVLSKLDPLWDWLFTHYPGLLQADNEGFYDHSELILESNLKI